MSLTVAKFHDHTATQFHFVTLMRLGLSAAAAAAGLATAWQSSSAAAVGGEEGLRVRCYE